MPQRDVAIQPQAESARAMVLTTTGPLDINGLCTLIKGEGPRRLLDAWLEWRGPRMLPLKSDMDLRRVARVLPWIGLLEFLTPEDVRLRVAGTALREVYGVEMTGRNLKDTTAPDAWPRRSARYRELVTRPCGSRHVRRDVLPDGKDILYETVSLPVDVDPTGSRRHVIFCIAALDQSFALERPSGQHVLPLPVEFAYVNIGAGAPSSS